MLVFGFAYLGVVLVHAGLFRVATRAINRTVAFNVGTAPMLIAAGFARGGSDKYRLWSAAMLVLLVTPYLTGIGDSASKRATSWSVMGSPCWWPSGSRWW